MKNNIKIRFAYENDAERLLEIYRPYVENTAISFEYTTPEIDEFKERMKIVQSRYPYIVAEENGVILGYAYAHAFVGRAAYDYSCEMTVYVDENRRQSGIGKLLYSAMEAILGKMNIINLNVCIGLPDENDEYLSDNSMKFHEHMGYRAVGVFHKCGYKFGRWYNMIWMEKMLGEHPEYPEKIKNINDIKTDLARYI